MKRIGPNQKGWEAAGTFTVTELNIVVLNAMTKLAEEAGEKAPTVAWSYEVNGEGTGGELTLYKRIPTPPT